MLNEEQFTNKLIEEIKDKKLSPRARWRFVFKNYLIWILGIMFLFSAAVATSFIFFLAKNENFTAYHRAGGSLLETLMTVVPIFWIICLGAAVYLVYFNIKKTKKGYRYSLLMILASVVALVLIISLLLSLFKVDKKLDDELGRRAPYYESILNPAVNFWSNPQAGRLNGLIVKKLAEKRYLLINKQRDEWLVIYAAEMPKELLVDFPVRLIGQQTSDHEFMATEVVPMVPGRGFFKRPDKTPHSCLMEEEDVNCRFFKEK